MLPPGSDVARQSIPIEEIAAMLAWADSAADTRYLERFRLEFAAPEPGRATLLEQNFVAGYEWTKNRLAPGIGYDPPNWTGGRGIDDENDPLYGARLNARLSRNVAAGADLVADVREAQLIATAGYFGVWIGRKHAGYGVGHGGSLVLNRYRLDGGGLYLPKPLQLPVLGAVRLETHLTQINNVLNRNQEENAVKPWFWTARLSFEPLRHVRLGINRGMIFGGEGNLDITFGRVAKNLLGIYTDENSFANQIVSVDLRVRAPGVPLSVYVDWAADDAAGGWWDVPAILGGIEYAVIDRDFDLAFGAEHVQFSGTCCGNSMWYRNAWLRGGWADGETLFGHPLGGHGREWRAFTSGSFAYGRVNAYLSGFSRNRRAENLFAPGWDGKSTGVNGSFDLEVQPRVWLSLSGEAEWGEADWRTGVASAAVRMRW